MYLLTSPPRKISALAIAAALLVATTPSMSSVSSLRVQAANQF